MFRSKIKSLRALHTTVVNFRRRGKTIVFTNGCFDILHYGHVRLLSAAKRRGDILIVGLNSDSSVRKIKSAHRLINPQYERAMILACLIFVDYVTIFKETTPALLIEALKPDVLVKGGDWQLKDIAGADFVASYGGSVVRIPLVKDRSTTAIIKKIGGNN